MTDHQHTADVLNRAADLIEERGWATGNCGMAVAGPMCMEGALAATLGTGTSVYDRMKSTPNDLYLGQVYYDYSQELQESAAYRALCVYLGRNNGASLFSWNDSRADASEVIEVLRAAAAIEQSKADAEQPVTVTA